jgi:hypothetical protein
MKYNIENNIDFYKELYTSLNDDINLELENELCLITNLPLKENFIRLKCGHKFNYDPLYKDIFNHKKIYSNMEQSKNKPKTNQLRCPYCRNIQNELLPYHEELGYPKVNGVNFLDTNNDNNYCIFINPENQCQYQIVNSIIENSGNTHTYQCKHFGYVHYSLKTKYNIDSKYCYSHKLAVTKSIKEELKEKAKAIKLEEKTKKKEEKLKIKMEIAQKKLADKAISYCKALLKTGKNKGNECKSTVYKNCLCKRHYNLENKDIEVI